VDIQTKRTNVEEDEKMIKVLSTRNNMIALAEAMEGGFSIIFADGSQKDVKQAAFERHYKVLDENATANDFSAPEGVNAIGKDEAEAAKKEAEEKKKAEAGSQDGKTPEQIEAERAAKKAEREAKKEEDKKKRDAEKEKSKATKAADAAKRKAEAQAKKVEREAAKAAKQNENNEPFEMYPLTYSGSVATSTRSVANATSHTFQFEKFNLILTVENDTKGISPVKRGCHVQEVKPVIEEGKEPTVLLLTIDKCTSISKALGHIGVAEADINRAKKTIAALIKPEAKPEEVKEEVKDETPSTDEQASA
jgi:hypothetical protein